MEALPLEPGQRILEIGCGPGAMAREIARRIGDGRHPEAGRQARARIAAALVAGGRLFIDGGDPLKLVPLGTSS